MTTPSPNQPTPAERPPSGLVLIDKPADRRITSMAVCRGVKKRLARAGLTDTNRKKGLRVGHAGTLDPLASGLLIVLVGKATSLCNQLMLGEKTYEAAIDLGRESTTDDLEGRITDHFAQILEARAGSRPDSDELARVLAGFVGPISQRPPVYSAMLVDGKRAYTLARAGREVELERRIVLIHQIDVLDYAFPALRLAVRCGKGTYIRSMARDIGVALTGFPGCLIGLRRTAIGPYHVKDATPLEALPSVLTRDDLLPAP
jgi:tRNA pseudouridine55 synthase